MKQTYFKFLLFAFVCFYLFILRVDLMYLRLAQNVFMQHKQMQHTFTWLKKYSAT